MLTCLRWTKLVMAVAIFATSVQAQAKVLFFPDFAVLSSKLSKAGISGIKTAKDESGHMIYQLLDDSGAVMHSFAYNRTAAETLKQFKPSKMHTYLSYVGQKSAGIAVQKMMHLPAEVFTFFIAIGAVQTRHLVFHYNENPVAYDQFLTSQASPVGQVAFGAFMVANGLTAEPLSVIAESRSVRFLIPYLGMSAGMMASNITHEVLAIPGLGKCALNLMGSGVVAGAKVAGLTDMRVLEGCDEAFEAWVKIDWSEKGHEWAPALFSLAAATFVGYLSELGLNKVLSAAAATAAAQVIRVSAINMGLLAVPGAGWVVKGLSWGYRVASLVSIIYLQEELHTPFVFFWKNYVDLGPKLQTSQDALTKAVGNGVLSNWKTSAYDADVAKELEHYQELMYKWRQANMDTVLQRHGNWTQFLGQLSMEYRVARKFYFDFVTDVWKKTYELPKDYVHLMDRPLPLFGVAPMGFTEEDQNRFLQQPNKVQDAQMETVAYVYNYYFNENRAKMDAYAQKNLKFRWEDELGVYKKIVADLGSKDPNVVGRAIQAMRYRLDIGSMQGSLASNEMKVLLEPIFKALGGSPLPLSLPGQGYLKLLEMDPNTTVYKEDPYNQANVGWVRSSIPEKLVQRMMFGPDVEAGQKSISASMGFPAHFNPPMIRIPGKARTEQTQFEKSVPAEIQASIFGHNVWIEQNGKETGGGTAFDFLRNNGVRKSVIGDKSGQGMSAFWTKYPEKELRAAYREYQGMYEEIILEFYNSLFYKGKSTLNAGPVSNGLLETLESERDLYMYLLDTQLNLLKGKPSYHPFDEMPLMDAAKNQLSATQNAWTSNLKNEWQNVTKLLARIVQKEVAIPGKNNKELYLVSHVATQEFEEMIKKLDALVDAYPLQPTKSNFPNQMRAEKTIKLALEGLRSTQREMINYAAIVNIASYVETYEGTSINEAMRPQCLFQDKSSGTADGCPVKRTGTIYLPR